jgi:hypothetical protein
MYRYFYDCEFIEDGRVVDLVSIGVVDERGREFYAVSTEFDPARALPWVRRHVLDKLPSPGDPAWRSRRRIRDELREFLTAPLREDPGGDIELWAWFAAYDHVALAQLWGAMPDLPREIPRFTKDLRLGSALIAIRCRLGRRFRAARRRRFLDDRLLGLVLGFFLLVEAHGADDMLVLGDVEQLHARAVAADHA